MEAPVLTFPLFSPGGSPAKAKYLVLGPAALSADRFRSLNFEHVSAAELIKQEISRHSPVGRKARAEQGRGQPLSDETMLDILRRWFWTRKPDAGFVLTDFPATLLQAKVMDEWMEVRGIALDAVLVGDAPQAPHSLLTHYRTQGVDILDASALVA